MSHAMDLRSKFRCALIEATRHMQMEPVDELLRALDVVIDAHVKEARAECFINSPATEWLQSHAGHRIELSREKCRGPMKNSERLIVATASRHSSFLGTVSGPTVEAALAQTMNTLMTKEQA